VFNSLFGWQNSATYGSVISYNLYWIVVSVGFLTMRYNEKMGHWPWTKKKAGVKEEVEAESDGVLAKNGTQGNEKVSAGSIDD